MSNTEKANSVSCDSVFETFFQREQGSVPEFSFVLQSLSVKVSLEACRRAQSVVDIMGFEGVIGNNRIQDKNETAER